MSGRGLVVSVLGCYAGVASIPTKELSGLYSIAPPLVRQCQTSERDSCVVFFLLSCLSLVTEDRDFLWSYSPGRSICSGLQVLSDSHERNHLLITCRGSSAQRMEQLLRPSKHYSILSLSQGLFSPWRRAVNCTLRCKHVEDIRVKLLKSGYNCSTRCPWNEEHSPPTFIPKATIFLRSDKRIVLVSAQYKKIEENDVRLLLC